MLCRNCQRPLAPAANYCQSCNTQRQVFCIHCGNPVLATATHCPVCSQPQFGSDAIVAAMPRYVHPNGIYNIAVPPPWEISARNIMGIQFTAIDRPAQGVFGNMRNAIGGVSPAGLQLYLLSVPPRSDQNVVNQVYTQYQAQIAAQSGGGNVAATMILMARPVQQQILDFQGLAVQRLDYTRSVMGFAKQIERRLIAVANLPQLSVGVVMVQYGPEGEFRKWEQMVLTIASSFRFGGIQQPSPIQASFASAVQPSPLSQPQQMPQQTGVPLNFDPENPLESPEIREFLSRKLESERQSGQISQERYAEFDALLSHVNKVVENQSEDPAEMMAEVGEIRQMMKEVGQLTSTPIAEPTSRADQLSNILIAIRQYLNAEATKGRTAEKESEELERLVTRCVQVKQAIESLQSDETAFRLEHETLRKLASEVRNFSLRHHLTVGKPYWPSPPITVKPNAVFYSGGLAVEKLLNTVCKQHGLEYLKKQDYGQERWNNMRTAGVCVFDITSYLNDRSQMGDVHRAGIAAVCYEMGMAMTLGKPVVVVGQIVNDQKQVPFDIDIEPVYLTNDPKQNLLIVAREIDRAIYGFGQRGGTDSSLRRSVDYAKTLLASHPDFMVRQGLNMLTDDILNDSLKTSLVLNQILGYAGTEAPLIMYPAFPAIYPQAGAKKLFHVTSYKDKHSDRCRELTDQACKEAGVEYERGDLLVTKPNIIHTMWNSLSQASHVLVDLTPFNPNAAFELGVASVLGPKSVMIVRRDDISLDHVPQLKHLRILNYDNKAAPDKPLRTWDVPLDKTAEDQFTNYIRSFVRD